MLMNFSREDKPDKEKYLSNDEKEIMNEIEKIDIENNNKKGIDVNDAISESWIL